MPDFLLGNDGVGGTFFLLKDDGGKFIIETAVAAVGAAKTALHPTGVTGRPYVFVAKVAGEDNEGTVWLIENDMIFVPGVRVGQSRVFRPPAEVCTIFVPGDRGDSTIAK